MYKRPISLLLTLVVLLTGLIGCVSQPPAESESISSEADSAEASSQNDYTEEVVATIDFKEPKTRDCIAFSIDLPGNLGELLSGEKFFSRKYGIMMLVQKCSKLEIRTIEEYAEFYYDIVDGYGGITTSTAGHLCFTANNEPAADGRKLPSYIFFVENAYYCYAVSFTCNKADFSKYLPYFREREGTTAVYEDNVEKRILNETLQVETDDLILTVPAEMWKSEDPKWDLAMYSSTQISLWVGSLKKTEISDIFSLEDCIRKIFFEEGYIDSSPGGLVTDDTGHTVFIDIDYNVYSVFLEKRDKYIAVYFQAPDGTFDLYLPMFQEWGNKIVVKNALTAQQ